MSAYSAAVLADSPVGYWRLDESSGNALDLGSSNKPLTYNGTPTRQVVGALVTDTDTAVDLNGTSHNLSSATSADLGDTFTIEAWIRRDNALRSEAIFGKLANGPLLYFASAGNNFFTLRKGAVGNVVTSTVGVADTNWHYVAATKNGAAVFLYLDGRDVSGTVTNQTMSALTSGQAVGSTATPDTWFDGRIDEVAVYTLVLTAAQVLAHYRAGVAQRLAAAGVG